MAINRSALKRTSASALLEKVKGAANQKGGKGNKDDRFWEPTVDANGNGFAIIRFLPSKTEEGLPFVKIFSHGFQVGTKWFIESCPTTVGDQCPVCDSNSEYWNSGFEADKKIASARKRKLRYVSNIIVIKDPKNPENEGKVFLYSYGQKIFEKLSAAMNPPEEYGEVPRDPFAFFDGCVVKLKIKNLNKQRNYDDTVVEAASDLFDGDEEKLEDVINRSFELEPLIAPEKFKSFDDMKTAFLKVIGSTASAEDKEPQGSPASGAKEHGAAQRTQKPAPKAEPEPTGDDDLPKDVPSGGDGDDDMEFFRSLAND